MKIKTQNKEYELIEFNYHIDSSYESPITILELLIDTKEINFVKDLSNSFIVETLECTYVFSDFEVQEYYMVNNSLLQVLCVKCL